MKNVARGPSLSQIRDLIFISCDDFRHTLVQRLGAEELAEARATVGLGVLFRVRVSFEFVHAEGADEVFRVPFLAKSIDRSARDGLLTASAAGAHLLVVMGLAIGQAFVLEERACEGFVTELAVEVLRMPLGAQCIHTVTKNRLIAGAAARREHLMEAAVAIRTAVALEEVAREGRCALCAHKAMYVPFLV